MFMESRCLVTLIVNSIKQETFFNVKSAFQNGKPTLGHGDDIFVDIVNRVWFEIIGIFYVHFHIRMKMRKWVYLGNAAYANC